MIKARIYGAVVCRAIILLVLFVLLAPFFVLYVVALLLEWVCGIGQAYFKYVALYVADTKVKLLEWNKLLNP